MEKKLKIGLYLSNFGFSDIDLSNPESGNPGIGGTLFNFVTLPYYFEKHFPDQVEWHMIGPATSKLPEHIKTIHIDRPSELESVFEEHKFDYFIWKPANTTHFVPILERYNQPAIAWCHNIPGPKELKALATSTIVKKAVFAGHEALDVVRDHKIILKSTVIYNGFDPKPYLADSKVVRDKNHVVYLGSLHPAKCFHMLAEVWPEVLKKRPEARLTVIGSGKLYDRNNELGPFGLAEKGYEDKFTKPLLTSEGTIHPSVIFAGLLGEEKIPLLQQASVGVINPHGKSEVCPGSAIEFQACGTPVVAGARYGNLDTIINRKTGFLIKSLSELTEKILLLLNDAALADKMGTAGKSFVSEKFAQQRITEQWNTLFHSLKSEAKTQVYPMKSNWLYNFKIVFEVFRIMKFKLRLFNNLPSVFEYIETKKGNDT